MEIRKPYLIRCYRSDTHYVRQIAATSDIFRTTQFFAEVGAQNEAKTYPIVVVSGPDGWWKKISAGFAVEGTPPFLVEDMN